MENKQILESLEQLRRNKDYQYLCTHLNELKEYTEKLIYDEATDHEYKKTLIIKRNTILKFIELPTDLIQEFQNWDTSDAE